ncbi:shootin-1 [Thrips palmi]|uniref:Shootin-1 n=1 Tax=Thrips palmi TaxID=161013 RepID=A0A6P9ADR2_THRPL|nr:shootin-1 [Thrips palmi]
MNINIMSTSTKSPGPGPGNVKQMTSLYAAGRQPSQTQIPVPKKFTSSMRVGLDNGSPHPGTTSPSPVRSSSVAARAQMFQSGSNNANANGGGFHSRSGSSSSSNGSFSRTNSSGNLLASGGCSPTKTVTGLSFNGKSGSNGSAYGGSSVAFSNGAPPSPARLNGSSVAFSNGAPLSPARNASSNSSSVAFSNGAPLSPRNAPNSSSVAFNNGAPLSPARVTTNGSSVALSNGMPPVSPLKSAAAPVNGSGFSNGAPPSPGLSPSVADKWRAKYEDAERKRKALLTSSEKNAREASELQRKLQQLQKEHDTTKRELKDREDKLTQLRTVSERVYKEYDQLKNRYEVETGAMHQAMQRASEWYKQNRELKRRSTAIMQKVIQVQPDGALLDLLADETDAAQAAKDEDDLEDLRNTVKRLSGEVARLQSELNAARLQEFEAQEAAVTASAELDESRRTQAELAELRALRDNMAAAASLVQKEVAALRQQCEQERQAARRMKTEADMAVKERNVMAHQSSLLAEALSQDDRLLPMLAEVENLKRLLEEERCRVRELQALQEPHGDGDEVEMLDERLKIAEEELRHAATRADRAERESCELRERLSQMEKDLEERKNAAPPPPPPPMAPPMPPPPPPPPMPALGLGGGVAAVKLRTRGGSGGSSATGSSEDLVNAERNLTAVQDMANLLGIPRKPQVPEAIPGGAIDNIINEIKGGRFTLKATEQNLQKEKKEPPAVTEMLNILGTLRRRPKAAADNASVPSEAPRDVAL